MFEEFTGRDAQFVQPVLHLDQPVRWGPAKTCVLDYNQAVPFFGLEKQNLIRFIRVTVNTNPGSYEVIYRERA
jgi:hypothetical protein